MYTHQSSSARVAVHMSLSSVPPAHPVVPSAMPGDAILYEGWLLKKRRKKMQGFARRYFVLHQSGVLSYSFEPGRPARDQLSLTQAAVTTSSGHRDIHIDSSTTTFHIKCLTADDFNKWMITIRKFIQQDSATIGRRSFASQSLRGGKMGRTGALVEEIGNTIIELENAFTSMIEDTKKRHRPSSFRSRTDKDKKEHSKDHGGFHGLFRKVYYTHQTPETTLEESSSSSTDSHGSTSDSAHQRIQTALQSLKYQHATLVKSLSSMSYAESNTALHGTTLPSTAEEKNGSGHSSPSGYSTPGRATKRMSAASAASSSSLWFDAPEFDGPEEYIVDASPGDEGQGSKLSEMGSQISASQYAESSADNESDSEDASIMASKQAPQPDNRQRQVVRRSQLPSTAVGDEGSLFTVLKKNVGKDLSQVALPVSFNEPLTLLQRMAEELEYYNLLSQAVQATDAVDRLCYVAAFAVSGYANTRHRSGRKGFNPMLAETFEDSRMKFIAEKVCHNPVVLAYHAEGDGWELYASSSGKTKFWGKSLEIIPQGVTHLRIGDDHYEWKRPSSFMRNIMMGTKYLEHVGTLIVQNTSTGARCILEFKESGYWGPSNMVDGKVVSPVGKTEAILEGKWDEQMARKLDASNLRVLWRITPFPKNAPDYYGFTTFGITLNEITPELEDKIPPTDSRLRPDVRALEEGNVDLAELEKLRVEEMQRNRRKEGVDRRPRWFKQVGDEWVYLGGYWEQRAQCWKDIDPLW